MHDTYIHDFYTVISGFNVECLYNNKVLKFPLNISQEKCLKNWHNFWHFGMPSWDVETPYDTLARLLARWHVKWKVGKLLARNHIGTEAMLPLKARWLVNQASTQVRFHADHADMQASMLRNLENSNGSILLWKPLTTISLPSKSAYQISRVSFFFSLRFSVLLFP